MPTREPVRGVRPVRAVAVVAGLAISAAALATAPALLPAGYSWISRTISESAAQGLAGGWLGRLGFLLFGLSVLLLADVCRRDWGPWGTALHAAFGVLMTAVAAFSHQPWQAGVPFDRTEDLLHSIAATGMGLAFAAGVVAVVLERARRRRRLGFLDVMAVAASVAIPLAMSAAPSADGLLQRLMFGVAYAWYVTEAVRGNRPAPAAAVTEASGRPLAEPAPARR
jgi:hypothetical protein